MFRFNKTLNVLTLFHAPQNAESNRVLSLLRLATTNAEENTLFGNKGPTSAFELEIVDAPNVPTPSQLKTILEYVGSDKVGQIVQGAKDEQDAVKLLETGRARGSEKVQRPLLVDWNNGRAVIGADEQAIRILIKKLP